MMDANPFRCERKGCPLCNTLIPDSTEAAVQHVLENGVRNGVLQEKFNHVTGEHEYVETDDAQKWRERNQAFKESIKHVELDTQGRTVRIVGAIKASELRKTSKEQ